MATVSTKDFVLSSSDWNHSLRASGDDVSAAIILPDKG